MAAIDIGAAAANLTSSLGIITYTSVGKENPANDTGTLTSIEIWIETKSGTTDVFAGTFSAAGNVLTCRDSESLGDVTAGSKQTFSSVTITVSSGDYLGAFSKTGTSCELSKENSGSGMWYYTGECIDPTDSQTFTSLADRTISLYGAGATPAGNVTVTPGVVALTTTKYVPVLNLGIIPGTLAQTTTTYAPVLKLGVIPSTASLTTTKYAPVLKLGIIPPTATLTTTKYVPVLKHGIVVGTAALVTVTFAPTVTVTTGEDITVTPGVLNLAIVTFAPTILTESLRRLFHADTVVLHVPEIVDFIDIEEEEIVFEDKI